MRNEKLKQDAIYKAAALARGDGLSVLFRLCEKQKTISTRKVFEHIERTHEFMKDCANHIRELEKKLPPNATGTPGEKQIDESRMDYVAKFPGMPGYGALCVDDLEYAEDTAKTIADWRQRGATVERVTVEVAGVGMREYLAEQQRRKLTHNARVNPVAEGGPLDAVIRPQLEETK